MVGAGRRKVITCHVYGESRIPATVSHRTSKCASRVPHGPEVLWRVVRGRTAPGVRSGGRGRGGGRQGSGGGTTPPGPPAQIGRAHLWNPVTVQNRMPSSSFKKKKKNE